MHIFHSDQCLGYESAGHPECPDRVRSAVAALRRPRDRQHTWHDPQPCTDPDLLRVHRSSHTAAVANGDYFDADTPHFPQIDRLARLATGAAIGAAKIALGGSPAFSLMRPPGHHAERNRIMGFCYYNHLAVAVMHALASGTIERVSIFDFDCHHGNGTEEIVQGDSRVRFVSLHQSPCYPGSGLRSVANCHNYPLPPGTGPAEFLATCDRGLEVVDAFDPQLVAVSAGFDAYRQDPITEMNLDIETFGAIGRRIGALGRPTFAVLEGGYAGDLADCITAFINGWDAADPAGTAPGRWPAG